MQEHPLAPFPFGKHPQSLPSSTQIPDGCSAGAAAASASQLGGDRGAAAWGSAWGPAPLWPWESPVLAAAVLLRGRDEKKNNSRGFPSPPVLAPRRGPAGSFISKRQRLFHLPPRGANRSPLAAAALPPAARAGIGTRPNAAGTKWLVTRLPSKAPLPGGGWWVRTGHLCHLCSHRQSAQDPQSLAAPRCLQRNQGTRISSGSPCKKMMPGLCLLSFMFAQTPY